MLFQDKRYRRREFRQVDLICWARSTLGRTMVWRSSRLKLRSSMRGEIVE
jgi:hypothetical protein